MLLITSVKARAVCVCLSNWAHFRRWINSLKCPSSFYAAILFLPDQTHVACDPVVPSRESRRRSPARRKAPFRRFLRSALPVGQKEKLSQLVTCSKNHWNVIALWISKLNFLEVDRFLRWSTNTHSNTHSVVIWRGCELCVCVYVRAAVSLCKWKPTHQRHFLTRAYTFKWSWCLHSNIKHTTLSYAKCLNRPTTVLFLVISYLPGHIILLRSYHIHCTLSWPQNIKSIQQSQIGTQPLNLES